MVTSITKKVTWNTAMAIYTYHGVAGKKTQMYPLTKVSFSKTHSIRLKKLVNDHNAWQWFHQLNQ